MVHVTPVHMTAAHSAQLQASPIGSPRQQPPQQSAELEGLQLVDLPQPQHASKRRKTASGKASAAIAVAASAASDSQPADLQAFLRNGLRAQPVPAQEPDQAAPAVQTPSPAEPHLLRPEQQVSAEAAILLPAARAGSSEQQPAAQQREAHIPAPASRAADGSDAPGGGDLGATSGAASGGVAIAPSASADAAAAAAATAPATDAVGAQLLDAWEHFVEQRQQPQYLQFHECVPAPPCTVHNHADGTALQQPQRVLS